ncbi:MAG TPA: MMPL family transporter [Thermomicrobiales bacterium]|nr:MMPL family transporter [Thermomicrobiales bacterium]
MQPFGLTGRLAALSARHPWRVIGAWVALIVIAMAITAGFPASLSTEFALTNEPEHVRADKLIRERMRGETPPSPHEYVIVQSNAGLTVDAPEFQSYLAAFVADLSIQDNVAAVESHLTHDNQRLVSDDRTATIVPVFFERLGQDAHPFLDYIDGRDGQHGFTVVTGGLESIDIVFIETSESDLLTGESIGVSVALLVLVLVFGTLVAAGIPLALAILAITVSIGITMLVGHVFDLSIFVINMMIMIGLAVGIDYTLFIVGRYREERAKGLDNIAAIVRTGDTASKAVLFSGLTVVAALLGMLIVPSSLFKSLGAGAIFVVIVAVSATLTLLPAAFSLIGLGIDRGRGRSLMATLAVALLVFAALFNAIEAPVFFIYAYIALAVVSLVLAALGIDPFHRVGASKRASFWERLTIFVMRRPAAIVALTVTLLVGVSAFYFTIDLGESGVSTLPSETTVHRAFTLLDEKFSAISLEAPNTIVVDAANVNDPDVQAGIARLTGSLHADPDFAGATTTVNRAGTLAVIDAPMSHDVRSSASVNALNRLRDDYIPTAFDGVEAEALVTGPTAFSVDFMDMVNLYTPIVFAFVLGMSFLLLMLAFRSIVVPLKSVLMNLLSVGASYGLLVLVFQHGIGNQIFGFQRVERIDAWVPLMMFSILFGLSMDYHVFLLSRIREHYDLTRRNSESVAHGLRTTGSMITGAALIMVAVFGGFAMGELSMFQQMGFGLAVAVILDATIVRSVLVPATMQLLGDRNWYLPKWLEWLPKVSVEGVPEAEIQAQERESGVVLEGATAD